MEEAGKFEDRRDVRVFLGDLMGDVGLALGPKLDLKRDDSLLNLLPDPDRKTAPKVSWVNDVYSAKFGWVLRS